MLSHRSRKRGPFIGLDIGSHAVRAAELIVQDGRPTLQRFAQVALPAGAVGNGEVINTAAVGEALKRLWSEGKFSHRRVVVGVSSQRTIVRLADVPAMSDDELRTALKFEAEDLIPIPVEQAVLDFSTVEAQLDRSDVADPPKMRILLAAAQRDMVNDHLDVLKVAGLKPVAVDPVALALLRAIPPAGSAGPAPGQATGPVTEAVIAIGAGSTTVAIRENGVARFVRVLNLGGDDLVDGAGEPPPASGRSPAPAHPLMGGAVAVATPAAGGPLRALIDDIRGSLDFYLAQADTDRVGRIVVTGGAAMTAGLLPRLQDALRQRVEIADPLSTFAIGKVGLTPEQLQQAAPYLVTPIGLALWGTVAGQPISLLPREVLEAKRRERSSIAAAFAVTVFAALLGLAWTGRTIQVHSAQQRAEGAEARIISLNHEIARISGVTTVQAAVKAKQQVQASALSGEVDWTRLIEQLTAVLPRDAHLTTLTVEHEAVAAPPRGAATTYGTFSVNVVAAGGADAAANWLRALATVPGLDGTTIQTIVQEVAPAVGVTFSSTSSVTSAAQSQRSLQAAAAK